MQVETCVPRSPYQKAAVEDDYYETFSFNHSFHEIQCNKNKIKVWEHVYRSFNMLTNTFYCFHTKNQALQISRSQKDFFMNA